MAIDLSIVVPVLNEEESVSHFVEVVTPIVQDLALRYEIIFVDDGSTDATADILCQLQLSDSHIRLIRLSRNFGKEAALTAGLDFSTGAAVVPMDVDMQDPPVLLREMVARWREGYDIAFGQRIERRSDTGTKRVTAGLFRGGRVSLNSDWQQISGSSAGCFFDFPIWGVAQGGRSPTGVTAHIGGQIHAATISGRLSKYV